VYEYNSLSHNFYRRIPLSVEVKADEAKGSCDNGVLRVEIPKAKVEEKKAKKVEIK
jgi:HSP20 family protein